MSGGGENLADADADADAGADAGRAGSWLLDEALTETIRRTGASAGGFHLWDGPAHGLLGLVVLCGVPAEVARPWHRISPAASTPVSDAVREDRLVWIGSQVPGIRHRWCTPPAPRRTGWSSTPGRCSGSASTLRAP
ncbi:hypothetical protein ACIOG8_19575 [Streptomyces erythrochromogenes]|uniref:hypothetical protein n=1 Tax=Streptomyces erythrochromogenes TaxID=285574 RepID=UPI00380018BA